MASPRHRSSTIKYKRIPLEVNDELKFQQESVLRVGTGAYYGRNLLSTAELSSFIGAAWRVVGHSPAACGPRDVSLRRGDGALWVYGSGGEPSGLSTGDYLPAAAKYQRLRAIKKNLLFCLWDGSGFSHSLLHRNVVPAGYGKRNCVSDARKHANLAYTCGSLTGRYLVSLRDMVTIRTEDKKKGGGCVTESKICSLGSLTVEDGGNDNVNSTKHGSSSGKRNINLVENMDLHHNSPCSAYLVASATVASSLVAISSSPSGCADCDIEVLPSTVSTFVGRQQPLDAFIENSREQSGSNESMPVNGNTPTIDPAIDNEFFSNQYLSMQDKLSIAFAKKKNALAGALAGTFVSIFLHPIDTVKTLIQAYGANRMTNFQTFQLIVSEKGFFGLYRGIASNIAASAPISAIYTFTYETVKAAMLPILPKEYHSLAHCTAGGCASIATSFIFTPTERIKQQMQVHSCYRNCRNALFGVLERGGFPSLYAGWAAVLCRNIPHSVIKFYTYERLKSLLLPLSQPTAHLSSSEALFCGGLAGSTAAIFTTPFDVVKTRLQTQVPGSSAKYDGVLHALQYIAEHEGLRGLYRGLTPRLAMYISQGAIFFASYEFLKTVFSLDMPDPDAQRQ